MNRPQTWSAILLTASALCAGALSGCRAAHHRITAQPGIDACPSGAADALLSVPALQCWLPARHGQWRTLSHESHFDVLVVRVEAFDLRDAEDIARRFVASAGTTFSEILIYAQRPRADGARIRRVRWTREKGSETIDFSAPIEESNPT